MTEKKRCGRFREGLLYGGVWATWILWTACGSAAIRPTDASNILQAELSSTEVVDGSILVVTLKTEEAGDSLSARFAEAEVPFFPVGKPEEQTYQAIVGVPFNHSPGSAAVIVNAGSGEQRKQIELPFAVVDGNYPSEVLTVDPRHVNPSKKNLVRIKREVAEVGKLYQRVTRRKHWQGPFLLPVKSEVTSPFGTRRVFNGEMRSFHSGLDLKAAVGVPIRAAAAGEVVLAKDLFFTGNTVLIDHGYGVFTLYAHLSRIRVKKGQIVKANQLLGRAGKTGRVSGPHLHWGAIIHKAKVNPMELTRILQ